ncbi:MAG: TIGR03016 family PEP-CTERM system-associated outer membrane protein [Pseudomonadota bacterium]
MTTARSKLSLLAMTTSLFSLDQALAQVRIEPRLEARATFTDNLLLTTTDKQADIVLLGSPGVAITAERQRLQANISYDLQAFQALDESSRNDIRHQLRGVVNSEVIRNTFYIRASAFVGQQFANVSGAISRNQANFTPNRRGVQNFSVSPVLRREFGSFGTGSLSYTFGYNNIDNKDNGVAIINFNDAISHRANARLASGARFTRLAWSLNGTYGNVQRSNNLGYEAYTAIADLSYALGRTLQLVGSGGYEDISDTSLLRQQQGAIWDAGLRWRPGPRLSLEGRAGRRFGGTTYYGDLVYKFDEKHSILGRYSEDIQVFGRQSLLDLDRIVDVVGGVPVDDNGVPVDVGAPDFDFTNFAFRQKRGTLSLRRETRKIATTARAFWERRLFSGRAVPQESWGGGLGIDYQIDARQSLNLAGNYRNTSNSLFGDSQFIAGTISYALRLSSQVYADARYVRSQRLRSDFVDLTENAVTIGVRATF